MSKYKVKFEIYGKKLVATVEAESHYRAELAVRNRLNIISTDKIEEPIADNEMVDRLRNIFNMK